MDKFFCMQIQPKEQMMDEEVEAALMQAGDQINALQAMLREAKAEICKLRAALELVREYPDFDEGGPLAEMMDQVLAGEPTPMLDFVYGVIAEYGPAT
jgi:hypothetical protein